MFSQEIESKQGGRGFTIKLLQWLHLDAALLFGTLLLLLVGLGVVYSASHQDTALITNKLIHIMLALVLMMALAQLPVSFLRFWSPIIYVIGVILLILVLAVGDIGKGAQRWLDIGVLRFQPSEMMKLATPMMVAWFFSERVLPPNLKILSVAALLVLVPTLLIAKQPDLGTALLILAAGFFVIFLAGISWRLLFGLAISGAALLPVAWHFMYDYQRMRVITFMYPEREPLGAGYHIIQSKIAIGSGGPYGRGWLNGTQSHLDFLPEQSTDFIFAVFGEEFGLIGALLLLSLYALLFFVVW